MAGIGFELRKISDKGGFFAKQKVYAYTSIIYAGPLLLGILLLATIAYLSVIGGLDNQDRNTLLGLISYSTLFSLIFSSPFSFVLTRYVSDMLYEGKIKKILPSFFASSVLMLAMGCIVYSLFLLFSGIAFFKLLLCLLLFGELTLIWNALNYLTALKDYRNILLSFFIAILATFLSGLVLVLLSVPYGLLVSACIGYGVMFLGLIWLLCLYFPNSLQPSFEFLTYFDRFGDLFEIGSYLFVGLFAHILMTWFSVLGERVDGLLRTAPVYDVPAMFAFLTTLVATVSFVVSVEVLFYPKFQKYFNLYNENGNLLEIEQAEVEMLEVLQNELKYLAWKQLMATVLIMFLGNELLSALPLGFNAQMRGFFQTLCLAYGLYGIGNANLLALLYFADYQGAKQATKYFAISSVLLTFILQFFSKDFYGFGFLIASILLFFTASRRLHAYIKDLSYHILGSQPILPVAKSGKFTLWAKQLDGKIGKEDL